MNIRNEFREKILTKLVYDVLGIDLFEVEEHVEERIVNKARGDHEEVRVLSLIHCL